MRKHFIDNLRSIVILLLFPFHTLRLYTAGDPFYIEGTPNLFADIFISASSLWFMNLLFVLAGMSTAFSLQKRTVKQYWTERIRKLLIPFVFGVILTVPIQTYYAERFHNGYQGGFFEQYLLFFTKVTDLTGYRGGLTPAHLWFLLFLLIISILSLPVILYIKKHGRRPLTKKPSLFRLLLLFFPVYVFSLIDLGGEELGQYMTYFLLGYIVLFREEVLSVIKKYAWLLTIAAIICCSLSVYLTGTINLDDTFALPSLLASAFRHFSSWVIILTLMGLGQRYLNETGRFRDYMAKNSFSIYFVHQTVLVAIAFYIVPNVQNTVIQVLAIMLSTFLFSVFFCELFKRNAVTGFMFGMRK